jgi:NDP-sugar pyrophosphorylase family protein
MNELPALFDLGATAHARLFAWLDRPWEALAALEDYLGMLLAEDPFGSDREEIRNAPGIRGDVRVGPRTRIEEGVRIEGIVHIGADCLVETGAYIRGPAWIGDGCEVRQGAYLRGVVLAGKGAVLGHASEFKRCVLLEGAQAPHFDYVGDSILGIKSHIGAGVILSNLRLDKRNVRVALLEKDGNSGLYEDSGLQKFGALIGDGCEVGCNSVLNPGTILGARTMVAPLTQVKGTWAAGSSIP